MEELFVIVFFDIAEEDVFGQDEAVFGTVIEMMKPETLQDIINLSCNMDKFRYLPGVTTEAKSGEYLLSRNTDMAM